LSYEQAFVFVNQFNERQTFVYIVNKSTVDGYTFMVWYAADFPALAHIGLGIEDAFEGRNLIASPDGGLQVRLKFVGLHFELKIEN
jgi:hypothetical protein